MSELRLHPDQRAALTAVTVIVAVVTALTFLFGFGNVWTLALRLGVPAWVAPLVAPSVDLSVVALLVGVRQLALAGSDLAVLRPARRLLIFCGLATLALNVAEPLSVGAYGTALFDAVGPVLLIGWADVGPAFLRAIASVRDIEAPRPEPSDFDTLSQAVLRHRPDDELLEQARVADSDHWARHQRPISVDRLRMKLRVGSDRARMLVATLRQESAERERGTQPASVS
jgi:hypothetical protein